MLSCKKAAAFAARLRMSADGKLTQYVVATVTDFRLWQPSQMVNCLQAMSAPPGPSRVQAARAANADDQAGAPQLTGADRRRQKRAYQDAQLAAKDPQEWARVQAMRRKSAPFQWDKCVPAPCCLRLHRGVHAHRVKL